VSETLIELKIKKAAISEPPATANKNIRLLFKSASSGKFEKWQ